jgi:peroxiredoxin
LPTAQGSEVGIEDYRGKQNVIVWLTKGMGCPFCRSQMSQLARSYDDIRKRGAEVLEVSISPLSRAHIYAQKFKLPFPYLCDPDYRVHNEWKLASPPYGLVHAARAMWQGMTSPMPENDFFKGAPPLDEMRNVLRDDEMGFFIVDKQGVVRYALASSYASEQGAHSIPSGEEILAELGKLT